MVKQCHHKPLVSAQDGFRLTEQGDTLTAPHDLAVSQGTDSEHPELGRPLHEEVCSQHYSPQGCGIPQHSTYSKPQCLHL